MVMISSWYLLGFDLLQSCLEGDGMLEISNVKMVFTYWNSMNSKVVYYREVFADMNIKSHPLLRPCRHMNFLKSQ